METPARPRFWNVPNTLSVGRIVLTVFVCALIAYEQFIAALVVFAIAALTDALDGYLARRLGQTTAVGRQLDPLVDKVMVAAALIYLLTVKGSGLAPWMVAVIVVRELLIQGLRSLLEGQGRAFGAKWAGKLKTLFQCLAIGAILLCLGVQPSPFFIWTRDLLTLAAVGLTLYSGGAYLVAGWSGLVEANQ
jgi:CDP-diacylglycerol---glycerol-3-phosphate 3-phosphatidyltransferase